MFSQKKMVLGSPPPELKRYVSYDQEKEVSFDDQCTQYLEGIFKSYQVLEFKKNGNKNFFYTSSNTNDIKKCLNVLSITFETTSEGIVINEASLKNHYNNTKKKLVYLFVYLYLQTIGELDSAYQNILQDINNNYHSNSKSKEDAINVAVDVTVFEYKPYLSGNYLPRINYRAWKDRTFQNDTDLLRLLNDKDLGRLECIVHKPAYHPSSWSDPGPSTYQPPYAKYFSTKIKAYSVPSGDKLASLLLRHSPNTEDRFQITKTISQFISIKGIIQMINRYSDLISSDVKQLIDQQIDKEGNCKLTLTQLHQIWVLMPHEKITEQKKQNQMSNP